MQGEKERQAKKPDPIPRQRKQGEGRLPPQNLSVAARKKGWRRAAMLRCGQKAVGAGEFGSPREIAVHTARACNACGMACPPQRPQYPKVL